MLRFIEFALTLRYPERKRSAQIRYPEGWNFGVLPTVTTLKISIVEL
jgi:hypothetical protein